MKAVTTTVVAYRAGCGCARKAHSGRRQGHTLAHADVRISVVGATLEERAYFQAS